MARKSRKNIMPQSAAPEIRISEEVNLLRTAAYARLFANLLDQAGISFRRNGD